MNKKILIALASVGAAFLCFAEDASLKSANRKTAVRCLKAAEACLAADDFEAALSQSELGRAYDDSVADLWFVSAAAKNGLKKTKSEVLALVKKSLTEGEWVDYNRDGARILYADILCDTGKCESALETLDSSPLMYSADAEFIRAKAYYKMRTTASIQKARDKINAARKIYPSDTRFALLFFKHEYALRRTGNADFSNPALVKRIADFFISRLPEYENADEELEMYAAVFAAGERQVRMLNAFASHGMRHPLYAAAALKAGIFEQQEAWDYFCSFASGELPLEFLDDILPLLTESLTKESVKEQLNAFCGTLTADTDGDTEPNLIVKYSRGRPAFFSWDKDNDGIIEWKAECDFGSPIKAEIAEGNISVAYGTFPYAVQIAFKSASKPQGFSAKFNLLDETCECAPFAVTPYAPVKKLFQFNFFVPVILDEFNVIGEGKLFAACSSYEVPSDERSGANIRFSVLDGTIQSAEYSVNGAVYARTIFENGFPTVRTVDKDDDGIFETVETFAYDGNNALGIKQEESAALMAHLFGHAASGRGIYIKMIQIDRNADTRPDFTEEYLAFDGKISSWDNDGDGNWNVQYQRYPRENSGAPVIEDARFYGSDKKIVTVTSWNGQPVKVQAGKGTIPIIHGTVSDFYWLGDGGSADDEYFIAESLGQNAEQGVSQIFQRGDKRMLVVKIGRNVFAQVLAGGGKEKGV